jgi:Tn3 transposase DDE domain
LPFSSKFLEIRDQHPGEFDLMANAHALEEASRNVIDPMLKHHGVKADCGDSIRKRITACSTEWRRTVCGASGSYRTRMSFCRVAGSLKMGTVKPSEVIRGLQRGTKISTLGHAIGELGQIRKTVHLLNYSSDAGYRRHFDRN